MGRNWLAISANLRDNLDADASPSQWGAGKLETRVPSSLIQEGIMDNSSVWRSILTFFVLILVIGTLGVLFFASH